MLVQIELNGLPDHVKAIYELEAMLAKGEKVHEEEIKRLRNIASGGARKSSRSSKTGKGNPPAYVNLGLDKKEYLYFLEVAEENGIHRELLNQRLWNGWSLEDASTRKVQRKRKRKKGDE